MAKYNNVDTLKLMEQIAEIDRLACCFLYQYQTLTPQQLYIACYKEKDVDYDIYIDCALSRLISLKIVVIEGDDLFLTQSGVNIVRETLKLKDNVITTKNQMVERNYYRASKLRPKPQFLDRQRILNQTVFFIENNLKARGGVNLAFRMNKRLNKTSAKYGYVYNDQRHLTSYFETLKPHGVVYNKKIACSLFIIEPHKNELLLKADLNKFVLKHINSENYKEGLNEHCFFIVEECQKILLEPYFLRVKEEYEKENFHIHLMTQMEVINAFSRIDFSK